MRLQRNHCTWRCIFCPVNVINRKKVLAQIILPKEFVLNELSDLIRECAAGKAKAQASLYGMFAPKMFGVCMRYSKDQAEAEDNLQEGFIKAFQKMDTFKHQGSFEGWLRRIMVNSSLEKFRKQQQLYPVEDMSQFDSPEENDHQGWNIPAAELMKLIQELPPRYRMVFNLYVLEDMNHKDIAVELGITEGTSKSNLARARQILKDRVRNELMNEENHTA